MGGRVFHTDPRGGYLNDFDVHFYGVGWLNFSNLLNDNKGALAHVGRLLFDFSSAIGEGHL